MTSGQDHGKPRDPRCTHEGQKATGMIVDVAGFSPHNTNHVGISASGRGLNLPCNWKLDVDGNADLSEVYRCHSRIYTHSAVYIFGLIASIFFSR